MVDFDLPGLVVSDQATTYEGADFGHLGGGTGDAGVARGYQFARAQVVGEGEALVLGGFLHPGGKVASHCLEELTTLTERHLGRPRRRVECVRARLADSESKLARIAADRARLSARGKAARTCERLGAQREHQRQGD